MYLFLCVCASSYSNTWEREISTQIYDVKCGWYCFCFIHMYVYWVFIKLDSCCWWPLNIYVNLYIRLYSYVYIKIWWHLLLENRFFSFFTFKDFLYRGAFKSTILLSNWSCKIFADLKLYSLWNHILLSFQIKIWFKEF